MDEKIIKQIENFVRSKLPEWFIDEHIKVVVSESIMLQKFYPKSDIEVIVISAWLHDIGHGCYGNAYLRNVSKHHVIGVKISKKYLISINYNRNKLDKILHCILSHRTSKPPKPKTIESKIVASSDNLAHFSKPEKLIELLGYKKFYNKISRDLKCEFMLPQAKERAIKLLKLMDRLKE